VIPASIAAFVATSRRAVRGVSRVASPPGLLALTLLSYP